MSCEDLPTLDLPQYSRALRAERRPLNATLEVTQRCNNQCIHCYFDPAGRRPEPDPPLDFLLELMDVLAAEQTLSISFTGGEPLLRRDFAGLYEGAKRRGFLVSVLTNATLLTEELADLMSALPARMVSVSLYGATRETYEKVSRAPGTFDLAMAGIERLRGRGITGHLKMMALRSNHHEVPAVRELARELGWDFMFDSCVDPTVDGHCHVQCERLTPEEAVALEAADPERLALLRSAQPAQGGSAASRRLFACNAGVANVYIDVSGRVLPCGSAQGFGIALDRQDLRGSFRRAFHDELLLRVHEQVLGPFPCGECELRPLCPSCAASRELEVGSARLPLGFACEVARLRGEAIGAAARLPAGAAVERGEV